MDKPKPTLVYDVHAVQQYLREKFDLPNKSDLMDFIYTVFDCPAQDTTVTITDTELNALKPSSEFYAYIKPLLDEFGAENGRGKREVHIEYWW